MWQFSVCFIRKKHFKEKVEFSGIFFNWGYVSLQASAIKRLIPLLDRVLVQRAEALTKTAGGIVIPEKAQGKVLQGTIVAVGPGLRNKVNKPFQNCSKINKINKN